MAGVSIFRCAIRYTVHSPVKTNICSRFGEKGGYPGVPTPGVEWTMLWAASGRRDRDSALRRESSPAAVAAQVRQLLCCMAFALFFVDGRIRAWIRDDWKQAVSGCRPVLRIC